MYILIYYSFVVELALRLSCRRLRYYRFDEAIRLNSITMASSIVGVK